MDTGNSASRTWTRSPGPVSPSHGPWASLLPHNKQNRDSFTSKPPSLRLPDDAHLANAPGKLSAAPTPIPVSGPAPSPPGAPSTHADRKSLRESLFAIKRANLSERFGLNMRSLPQDFQRALLCVSSSLVYRLHVLWDLCNVMRISQWF